LIDRIESIIDFFIFRFGFFDFDTTSRKNKIEKYIFRFYFWSTIKNKKYTFCFLFSTSRVLGATTKRQEDHRRRWSSWVFVCSFMGFSVLFLVLLFDFWTETTWRSIDWSSQFSIWLNLLDLHWQDIDRKSFLHPLASFLTELGPLQAYISIVATRLRKSFAFPKAQYVRWFSLRSNGTVV